MQLIFVGDVQGCADELDELVGWAGREFGSQYELWFVGDLINRGPANLRVLDRVRELSEQGRARTILGNHEIALLRLALGCREPAPDDTFQELLERPDTTDWIAWLRSRPLVATGEIGSRCFAMVHAAVAPAWTREHLTSRARHLETRLNGDEADLERLLTARRAADSDADDLERLTRCRSVDPDDDDDWSSREPFGRRRPWHQVWAQRGHGYGVVYGHWALQGLHVARGLRGLDTGCVYHGFDRDGFLTAWLPNPRRHDPFDVPDQGFWRVRAYRRYWRGPDAR